LRRNWSFCGMTVYPAGEVVLNVEGCGIWLGNCPALERMVYWHESNQRTQGR
jgi:hypothetical protein